jgi:hypothetical protein
LLTLCFFFLCGAALGYFFYDIAGRENASLLKEYILQYADVCASGEDPTASVLSVLAVYLRYPLVILASGASAAGIVVIPLIMVLQGFGLSFSAICFAAALGSEGLWVALAAFGFRMLLILPATLLLSLDAFPRAIQLLSGRRESADKVSTKNRSSRYAKLLSCLLLLLAGITAELFVIPNLLRLALTGLC